LPILKCALWVAAVLMLISCTAPDEPPTSTGRRALIIVDMQYDFMPGGALPTSGGDEIVGLINRLQPAYDLVVATQDWHPQGHGSFASRHPGAHPGDVVQLAGLEQVLWPDHAVQGSHGADLVAGLDRSRIARVFRKGTEPDVDSYSGFYDNGRRGDTGLADYLREQGVAEVAVVGLALDYCVKYTALDAARSGFRTSVIVDASRAVNLAPGDGEDAVGTMRAAGVRVARSASILDPAAR
jgi:nicotinamidase/pyrazinamidase